MSQLRAQQMAFTLLEVMVALVIFSICALILLEQSARSIRQNDYLNNRLKSLWIADNAVQQIRMNRKFPAIGYSSSEQIYAAENWIIESEITATSRPDLRKISVTVSKKGTDETGKFEVITFIGRY